MDTFTHACPPAHARKHTHSHKTCIQTHKFTQVPVKMKLYQSLVVTNRAVQKNPVSGEFEFTAVLANTLEWGVTTVAIPCALPGT